MSTESCPTRDVSMADAVAQFGMMAVLACFHDAGWPANTTAAAITAELDEAELERALLGSDPLQRPT